MLVFLLLAGRNVVTIVGQSRSSWYVKDAPLTCAGSSAAIYDTWFTHMHDIQVVLRTYAVQIAQKIKVLTRVYYNLTHVYYEIVIPCVYYLNHSCVDNFSKCYKIMYHACLIVRLCACISKFACACFRIISTFESTWPFRPRKTDWGITH